MIETGKDLFNSDAMDKQYKIDFGGFWLGNDQLYDESLTLTESVCKEDNLLFGCCEASILQFRTIGSVQPMKGLRCSISVTVEGGAAPFVIGSYTVDSDKPTADRRYRDITAYDAMYDILNADAAGWYNSLTFPLSLKAFRDSFFQYFGITQEAAELANDGLTVTETIKPSELSGRTVITAICEINGCFGRIGRDGRFQYVFLRPHEGTLYPAEDLYPSDSLFPCVNEKNTVTKSQYISCQYEDFRTALIDKVQIRQEENDIGAIAGEGTNCYIVQDNFLVYGMAPEPLAQAARNLLGVIDGISYRPATVEAKGNPCFEPGDAVRLYTDMAIIDTYILQRTLKGVQALRDTYEAAGEEYQAERVNSVNNQIIQLRGKTNTLTRTVEETRLEIKDMEAGLSSRITQTAQEVTTEVTRATTAEGELSGRISLTAGSLTAEIKRATETEGTLSSKITQNAESIAAEVSRATEAEGTLSSRITQTADDITLEAQRAGKAEGELAAKISVNAKAIELKVSEGEISSKLSVESGKVSIKSNRFEVQSTNCNIYTDGTIEAKNIKITGGSIDIQSSASSYDIIRLRYASGYCGMDSFGIDVYYPGLNHAKITGGTGTFDTKVNTEALEVNTIRGKSSNAINIGSPLSIAGNTTFVNGYTHTFNGSVTMTGTLAVKGTYGINFESSSNYAKMGSSSGYVGFFGSGGATKKTVSTLSSSATLSTCVSKVNDLINALKAYNLIG